MKALEKELSLREKILLLILAIIILGFAYYFLVDQPVKNQEAAAQSRIADLETELSIVQAKLGTFKMMEEELGSIKNGGFYSTMPSYNASHEERQYLDEVLSSADQFSVNFSDVTRNGDQIRRDFSISFSVLTYDKAMDIIARLNSSPERCLIGNVSCAAVHYNNSKEVTSIVVNGTATFYETMVGGVVDAGLPADESVSDAAAAATSEAVDSLF